MARPLNSYGITAYSWFNALGVRTYRAEPPDGPGSAHLDGQPLELLAGTGLRAARELPFSTHWGRSALDLPPMPETLMRHQSRCSQLLWASLERLEADLFAALARWGAERVGLVVGSSTGGIDVTEHVVVRAHRDGDKAAQLYDFDAVHPFSALLHMMQAAFGLRGPGYVVSTACSSSGKALAAAQRLLEAGVCDAVVTAGADALCQLTLRGFSSLGILSAEPCRPFDRARDGISIGEGSAVLLLERVSPSPLLLLGVGESSDAFHTTAPHPEGLGAQLALQRALELGALQPEDVDYVNAHGTGTPQNDVAEVIALAAVLGTDVAFSSTKDRVGHQLGAAGITEAAFCLEALSARTLLGNRAGTQGDPALPAQPLTANRKADVRVTLSNSFAFGGSNVVVALGRADARGSARIDRLAPGCAWVESVGFWAPGYPSLSAVISGRAEADHDRPAARLLPTRARGRASTLTRLFAELLGQVAPGELESLPMVFGSALGEMGVTLSLLDQLGREEQLSPARFQASVHNTAAGLLSIALGNRAFSTTLAAGAETFAMSLLEALSWLSVHGGSIAVLVADEDAPAALMRTAPYPAVGLGLRLHWASSPPPGALARLGELERRGGQHVEADHAARVQASAAERVPGLERAPASQGLPLAWALLEGRSGRYAVGDDWTVQLDALPARG